MVLTLVEHANGIVEEASLETLTLARDVAGAVDEPVSAVAFGDGADGTVEELGEHGVDEAIVVEHDELDSYAPYAWAATLDQLVDDRDPDAVVVPGSDRGHEVLSHLGARRNLSMAANCLEVTPGEEYELVRQRWGGTLMEEARLAGERKLLSAPEHEHPIEPVDDPAEPAVETFEPELDDDDLQVRVERYEEADEEGVPLGEARVVVGGGRGVGSAEGFDKLEELAELLGGTVGSSRAAVNEGWRPHDDQIGQTGNKIAPDIYIAAGLSGAVQHMVGCKGADTILAINTDPEAAIIQKADWAVIADLHEVVPELNEALEGET